MDCSPPGSSVHGIQDKSTGVDCYSLLQIFPTQGSPTWKQPKCPQTDEWMKMYVYINACIHTVILLNYKLLGPYCHLSPAGVCRDFSLGAHEGAPRYVVHSGRQTLSVPSSCLITLLRELLLPWKLCGWQSGRAVVLAPSPAGVLQNGDWGLVV